MTNQNIRIAVLGGDARQIYAAEWLQNEGCSVCAWGLCDRSEQIELCHSAEEAVACADVLLLPLPLSRDRLQVSGTDLALGTLIPMLRTGVSVFCGMPYDGFASLAQGRGAEVYDYSQDEVFLLRNALPTAEGAVAIAMNDMRRTLFDSQALVVGYGRIAKLLSDLLVRMGVDVTVAARKETDLALAELHGCHSLPLRYEKSSGTYSLQAIPEQYHVIFNTVPAPVIGESVLRQMSRSTVLIDLASAPGGIDYDAANMLGLKTVVALSLPGKVAPMTAGAIIGECVLRRLREGGIVT